MQFHVDSDNGASISGWVVPDNPSLIPSILISIDGSPPERLEANVTRPDLRDLGLHRTGIVGFDVTEQSFPGLSAAKTVNIWEAESHLQIFGRSEPERHVKLKLFYCALSAMPQAQIHANMRSKFSLSYDAVERHPFDTMFGLINNQFAQSICLIGRPHFKRYQQLLANRGFIVATMLRDPYEELAERFLFARYTVRPDAPAHLIQSLSGLESLVDLASNFDISKEKEMIAAFSSLEPAQEFTLANPFVRTLACEIDEPADRKHVSIALDNLSTMTLVGLRQRFDTFKSMLNEIAGSELLDEEQPVDVSMVPEIAEKMARIPKVRSLLTLDVTLFTLARDAIRRAIAIT